MSRDAFVYDHHSADYARGSVGIHRRMRSECPVAWSDAHDGFWVLTRYEDVARASRDDATFSSDHDIAGLREGWQGVAIPAPPVAMIPLEVDPPAFHSYRRLVNPAFSPGAVERWTPFITDVVTACLDRSIESGRIDLVLDLANPVPAIVTLALLGLPLQDWYSYAEPMHTVVFSPPGSDEYLRAAGMQLWIVQQLAEAVQERREEPRDDLLSDLARATLAGDDPLDVGDAVALAYTIMAGGVDTTTALIANALVWLADRPGERRRLAGDPAALALAREEFLRYFAPVQAFARTVTTDTDVAGCRLSRGERVLLSWASANRDETVFDRPDEVVIDRPVNRHASFGLGIHRCLGSSLARHEFDIVLGEVLRRMPDYTVDARGLEGYESIGNINGLVRVPATFTPGPRRGSSLRWCIEGEEGAADS